MNYLKLTKSFYWVAHTGWSRS